VVAVSLAEASRTQRAAPSRTRRQHDCASKPELSRVSVYTHRYLRSTHVVIQVRKPVVVRCTKTPEAPRDDGARGDESSGGDEACVPVDRQKDAPCDDCAARNDSRCLGIQDGQGGPIHGEVADHVGEVLRVQTRDRDSGQNRDRDDRRDVQFVAAPCII
jgi:hypothetical protein